MIPKISRKEDIDNIKSEEDFEEVLYNLKKSKENLKNYVAPRGSRLGIEQELKNSNREGLKYLRDKFPEYFL